MTDDVTDDDIHRALMERYGLKYETVLCDTPALAEKHGVRLGDLVRVMRPVKFAAFCD